MKAVFVDAACLVSIINPRDQLHQVAVNALELAEGTELITTDAVMTEVLNYYAERGEYSRQEALKIIKHLMGREDFNLIHHSKYLFHMGLERFEDRQDKGYSLTDCMSMIVMENYGIQEVLTSDKHFKQAGFTILM
jgi:uncharacterized protein